MTSPEILGSRRKKKCVWRAITEDPRAPPRDVRAARLRDVRVCARRAPLPSFATPRPHVPGGCVCVCVCVWVWVWVCVCVYMCVCVSSDDTPPRVGPTRGRARHSRRTRASRGKKGGRVLRRRPTQLVTARGARARRGGGSLGSPIVPPPDSRPLKRRPWRGSIPRRAERSLAPHTTSHRVT